MYGGVPNLNFNPDNRKVNVNYYNPDNANDNLGSRISLGSLFLRFPGPRLGGGFFNRLTLSIRQAFSRFRLSALE